MAPSAARAELAVGSPRRREVRNPDQGLCDQRHHPALTGPRPYPRLQELAVLARAAGADPGPIRSGFGYRDIVRVAGAQVPAAPQVAEVIWKACSAIAHGDMRGAAAYLPGETVGQAAPGVALNRVTANVLLTVTGTMNALATTRTVFDLHARRARSCSWPRRARRDSQGTSGSADTG